MALAADGASTVKVFVGNIPFQCTEDSLKQHFSPAGNVISATIITRGPRSLGYGFVEFRTEADAQKAVTMFQKKEFDGRTINVEIARARVEGEAKPAPAHRGGRGGRGRRGGGGGGAGAAASSGAAGSGDAKAHAEGARADEPPKEPSKTTLFVANLPFSMDDDGLKEIFKGFKVTNAHVVMSQPRNRSKGFGFVELATEEEQKKALAAVDKQVVGGRPITVRVAMSELKVEGAAAPAAAPAAAAPAAAANGVAKAANKK